MTATSRSTPLLALVGAGLMAVVGLSALAAGVVRHGAGRDGTAPPPAPVAALAPVAAGPPAGAGPVWPQVEGSAEDPHFAPWCGSARGVPDLQPAVSFVIQWGEAVPAEELPRTAYAKDVAPDVQGYSEYGDYTIPGATGQEDWTEAVIFCLDGTGTPIANLPAVLDRTRHDP